MKTLKEGLSLDIESDNEKYFIDKVCLIEQVMDAYYKYVNADIEDNIVNLYNEIMHAYKISEILCKTIISIPHIKKDIINRKKLEGILNDIIENIKNEAPKISSSKTTKEVLSAAQTMHTLHIRYNDTYSEYVNSADEETLEKANKKIKRAQIILHDVSEYINICQEYIELPINTYYGFIRSDFTNMLPFGDYIEKDFVGNLLSLKAKLLLNIVPFLQETAKNLIENIKENKYPILSDEELNKMYLILNCSNNIEVNIARLINIIRSCEIIDATTIYKDVNQLSCQIDASIKYIRNGLYNPEFISNEILCRKRLVVEVEA